MVGQNEKRILSGPVSLDAWFEPKGNDFKLHVFVGCDGHRFGGEPEAPVRFKLRIREAELVVVVPETEPLSCLRSSVYRGKVAAAKKSTRKTAHRAKKSIKAKVGATLASLGATMSGQSAEAVSDSEQTVAVVEQMIVNHFVPASGQYGWKISAQDGEVLEGTPWDAKKMPLLVLSLRSKARGALVPVIRLELHCFRENLIFEDVEIKDDDKKKLLDKSDPAQRRRIAAAESYLRSKLVELFGEKISEERMAEPFARMLLGQLPLDVKIG